MKQYDLDTDTWKSLTELDSSLDSNALRSYIETVHAQLLNCNLSLFTTKSNTEYK